MLKIFYFLLNKSYEELKQINDKKSFKTILFNQKKNNFKINYYVLSSLNVSFNKSREHHQLILDSVIYYFNNHLKRRIFIYKISYFFGAYFFILLSIIHIFLTSIFYFFKGIIFFALDYKLPKINSKKVIICIGFPEHSFTYQKKKNIPASLIEFLNYRNPYKTRKIEYLSLDEYLRPSYNIKENKKQGAININRIKSSKKFNVSGIINLPLSLFKTTLNFFKNYQVNSFLFYSFYFNQYSKWHTYERFLTKIKEQNININETIMMVNHDIGIIKYEKIKFNLSVFCYSQNYFTPPSLNVVRELMNPENGLKIVDILSEINIINFSNFYHNQINFDFPVKIFNQTKKIINKKLHLNLRLYNQNKYLNDSFSNLGYEFLNKIKLQKNKFNILFCDVSIETEENVLRRIINGDIISTKEFGFDFYEDLIKIISNCDCQFYYKPKYSLNKSTNQNFLNFSYNSGFDIKKKITVLEPYDKIILDKQKFDLMINYPFTSTYYSFNSLSKHKIYYVPDRFKEGFKNISNDVVLGFSDLINLIRKRK